MKTHASLPGTDSFLNIKEAANLRTSVGAVHNLVYRKRLPAYKPFGRLLFKKSELDLCIEFSRKEIRNGNYRVHR